MQNYLTLVVREPDLSGNRDLLEERKPDGYPPSNVSACSEARIIPCQHNGFYIGMVELSLLE